MKGLYKLFIAWFFALGMTLSTFGQEVIVGTGTGTSYGDGFPTSMSYANYTWTEQLYTYQSIQNTGGITSIGFQYFYNTPHTRDVKVYLGVTSKTAFSGLDDGVPASEMTQVFSGQVNFTNTNPNYWVTIEFDTPFYYDGSGSLVVGFYDYTGTSFGGSTAMFYMNYASSSSLIWTPSELFVPEDVTSFRRMFDYHNNIKLFFSQLTITPASYDMCDRPNGYWSETPAFSMREYGTTSTVNSITHQNDYFTLNAPTVPFVVGNDPISFTVVPGIGDGEQLDTIMVNWNDIDVKKVPIRATAYNPTAPDVWELAREVSNLPYSESFTASSNLHNDYRLPGNTTDGKDAVFKVTFPTDVQLNASVISGSNGKVGVYHENFKGLGGPMPDNSAVENMIDFSCDFEEGNFGLLPWVNDQTYPWMVTTQDKYQGVYSMKSGNGGYHSTESCIEFSLKLPSNGTINFNYRISSESGYDKGWFYIVFSNFQVKGYNLSMSLSYHRDLSRSYCA